MGYKNPHPLENNIVFKISTKSNSLEEINEIISGTCDKIIDITSIIKQVSKKNIN